MCDNIQQCSENTLYCKTCSTFCQKNFLTDLSITDRFKNFIVTKDIKQKLAGKKGEIFENLEELRSNCYTSVGGNLGELTLIGKGGGGEAYKRCSLDEDGLCYVYKITPVDDISLGVKAQSLNSTSIVFQKYIQYNKKKLKHYDRMNLVEEYGNFFCQTPPEGSGLEWKPVMISIVELAATDLLKLLRENLDLPICVFRNIVLDVIIALKYWGENKINHNDLKADNIFISFTEPETNTIIEGYYTNVYGIKPLLADYDWATFDIQETLFWHINEELENASAISSEIELPVTMHNPDRLKTRYCNNRITNKNYNLGWRGQGCYFDPLYDIFSFLAELTYQLYLTKHTKLLKDFFPFVIACTGMPVIPEPTEENIFKFLNIVMMPINNQERMFRRWNYGPLPTKSPQEILSQNPLGYFTQFKL